MDSQTKKTLEEQIDMLDGRMRALQSAFREVLDELVKSGAIDSAACIRLCTEWEDTMAVPTNDIPAMIDGEFAVLNALIGAVGGKSR